MKYKLIKEYPGSPKLDSIVKLKNNGGYELENSTSYFMTKDKVENYPEFWEKVIEKNYKILSLARFCSIKPTITDVSDYGDEFIEAMLKCDKARIHSVKRTSDGEIFTVGDKIKSYNTIKTIISIFKPTDKLHSNDISFKTQLNIGKGMQYLFEDKVEKFKQPLFTTEDGVDIFEGDNFIGVDSYWKIYNCNTSSQVVRNKALNWKYFSTKEAAEEYILMNKPCLSLKDVASIYPGLNKNHENTPSHQAEKLKELVKSKIRQSV